LKNKGFSLIELITVIALLAVLSVIAAPKFLNISTDARLSILENYKAQAQEVIRNVAAIKNIEDRTYLDSDGKTRVRYSSGVDLLMNKDQLDIHDLCKAMGILDETLLGNDITNDDGYKCKYENRYKAYIQDTALSKSQCYLHIDPHNHEREPTVTLKCDGNTSECLCP